MNNKLLYCCEVVGITILLAVLANTVGIIPYHVSCPVGSIDCYDVTFYIPLFWLPLLLVKTNGTLFARFIVDPHYGLGGIERNIQTIYLLCFSYWFIVANIVVFIISKLGKKRGVTKGAR
jgi:hypothetical protein